MKCPLFLAACLSSERDWQAIDIACDKEECAWWDATDEQCGILTAALALDGLYSDLSLIQQKMPHADQFTR